MYSINNSGIKQGLVDGGLFKGKEIMGSSSDPFQNQQIGGLMRYRSAPSSYFATFLDGNGGNNINNTSYGDSSESESMFSDLLNCHEPSNNLKNHGVFEVRKKEINEVKSDPEMNNQNGNGFCNGIAQMGYLGGSYSLGVDNQIQVQSRNCSNLARQSSSPAGFFCGFDINGDASPSTSGLNNSISFTSAGPSSNTGFMPSIAEIGNETTEKGSPEKEEFRSGDDNGGGYTASRFSCETWDDIPFNNLKRNSDGEIKMFSDFIGLENQGMEPRNQTSSLTHHLSLPKTAVEMAAVEKYLQFQQDSVPCKIRAKRGCATHPRSIAERMRRIRISERMKKLQELFPTMDKQANTADMLDLAVEHIKNLQKQVQTLKETRAKCTCSTKQEHSPSLSSA